MYSFLPDASSSGSYGTSVEVLYIAVILSVVALVGLIILYYMVSKRDYLREKADALDYESTNAMVRDSLGDKPRTLSWSIFLYDDAKSIGLRYLIVSILYFFIAGTFGLGMRLSLTNPNPGLLTPIEYNVLLSEHAMLMIYMWAWGSGLGFAFYLLPSHLKVKKDSMGTASSIGFWLWLAGGILILLSRTASRWYFYPPLSLQLTQVGGGVYSWLATIGLELIFIGLVITCIVVIKMIAFDRDKDMKLSDMSLFTWSILFTVIMAVSSAPPLMVGLGMLFYDYFNPIFFTAASHQVLLFAILFWFWGHPIVYLAILPAFGLIYEIIPKFTGTKIYSYSSGVFGLGFLLIFSELVWGHHLFNSGLGVDWAIFFSSMSFIVVIPSAITVFNWIGTLWSAKKIRMSTPMMFAVNGIVDFIFGGVMGVILAMVGANDFLHGTYFVTAHFHFIFLGITTGIGFAAFYMLFPTISGGRKYDVRLARWHFYFTAVGSALMSFAWAAGGFLGMPRATAGYFPWFQAYQDASIIGGVIIGIGQLIFLYNMAISWLKQPATSIDNALETSPTGPTESTAGGAN